MSNNKFDGAAVKQVPFQEVPILGRFFSDAGDGYTKHSATDCYDDYSFRKIQQSPDAIVWVKE